MGDLRYGPEQIQHVNLLPAKSISSSAHAVTYVCLRNYPKGEFIVNMGATGAIGSSVAVSLKQSKSISGSSSAALAIGHYYTNAAAVASASIDNDTWVKTSVGSSGSSFKLTPSTNNITYRIPFDAMKLSASYDCVGIGVAKTAAATICGVTVNLYGPRSNGPLPTALAE
jgi:hypothetical protein